MNKRDMERIWRLQDILRVPRADTGGSKTATSAGFIGYAIDLDALKHGIEQYFYMVSLEYNYLDKLTPQEFEDEYGETFADAFPEYVNPDVILDKLAAWHKERSENGWEVPQYHLVWKDWSWE